MTTLVLLIIGPDRPGLVDLVSRAVAAQDGTWEESRMARLAGLFAGIVKVQVPNENAAEFSAALSTLRDQGLDVVVHHGDRVSPPAPSKKAALNVVGTDRQGIVQRIAAGLAEHGVNVEELETELGTAAMSGEPLFRAHAELAIPDTVDLEALRGTLEAIANDLMVDIDFRGDKNEA